MPERTQHDDLRLWKTHVVYVGGEVVAPEPDDSWTPRARQWFEALTLSAVAQEYEPSHWATAMAAADLLSYLTQERASVRGPSAQHWGEFVRLANSLFATPDAMRRAKVEVRGRREEEAAPDFAIPFRPRSHRARHP